MPLDPREPHPSTPSALSGLDGPADFELLDSVERIACVANEHRLAILGQLVAEPLTGAQVAARVGITAQLAHYHLKRLQEHGFVIEVPRREGARRSERFFRARARHLLVDPALACSDDATARALLASFEQVLHAWQRREVFEVDLAELARRLVGDCLDLGAGEPLLIVSQPQVREIVEHLYVEAEARGARPRLRPWSREYILARLDRMEPGQEHLVFGPPEELDELSAVVLVTSTQPGGPPPEGEQRRRLPVLMGALGDWLRAIRERGVRYVELSVPALGDLDLGQVTPTEAMAIFWRSLEVGPEELGRRARALLQRLADSSCATLTLDDGRGGAVAVDVEVERPRLGLGRLVRGEVRAGPSVEEFPPGSVSFLARPGSGTGRLHLPYVRLGARCLRELELVLEEGRLVDVRGEGSDRVLEAVQRASGEADALAEVRIGLSPAGRCLTGKASLDGVLEGAVSLTFGSNELLGGDRRATLDLCFPSRTLDLTSGAVPLVHDGRLAFPA